MKDTKKLIISFAISLIVVLAFQVIWNAYFKKQNQTIYVLANDVYKGEKIQPEDVVKVSIESQKGITESVNISCIGKIVKNNLNKGKVLESNDLQDGEIQDYENEYEYISIEVKDLSDSVAYQLKKGNYINLYFTSPDILSLDENENIVKNTKTIKVIENTKVIGLYDVYGVEVSKGNVYNAIMLRVRSEEAKMISNIKDEGNFNISLIK